MLNLSNDEILTALISAFSPSNPGSLRQSWGNRRNYAAPDSTKAVWELWEQADFRCSACKSHYGISLHHKNDNPMDSSQGNLLVLCKNCNRERSKRPVKNRYLRANIFRIFCQLTRELGRIPKQHEILKCLGISNIRGNTYFYHFLVRRFGDKSTLKFRSPQGVRQPRKSRAKHITPIPQ